MLCAAPLAAQNSASLSPSRSDSITSRELIVRVLDVGQGDATYIENGGSRVIIDGGPDRVRFGRLLDSLELNGDTIDALILSHVHNDHVSGASALFDSRRRITVRYVFENLDRHATASLKLLRDSVAARVERGETLFRDSDDPCLDGQPICTLQLRGGARLHVLRPNPRGTSANNRSTALKLVGPDSTSFTMLFPGDAEREQQRWMLAEYGLVPGLDVDVVKAAHHGSCNGVSTAWLRATSPIWSVISVSRTNGFGHAHDQTLRLLKRQSVRWYRTDVNGTITIRTAGIPGAGFTISASGTDGTTGLADALSRQAACRTM